MFSLQYDAISVTHYGYCPELASSSSFCVDKHYCFSEEKLCKYFPMKSLKVSWGSVYKPELLESRLSSQNIPLLGTFFRSSLKWDKGKTWLSSQEFGSLNGQMESSTCDFLSFSMGCPPTPKSVAGCLLCVQWEALPSLPSTAWRLVCWG